MSRRRRLLSLVAAAFSSGLLLCGCLGNPPARHGARLAPIAPDPAARAGLETGRISLGFIPILEAAPLVVGVEKGFFARYGLEVNLSKQASWSAARDNVVLGGVGGGIDGGQWPMPVPQMISEGALTNGRRVPMLILAMLMSQGNGIAAAERVKGADLGLNLQPSARFFADFQRREGRRFRAAYSFPRANQDFWMRYWLAAGGIDPDRQVDLLTVPASETLQGMRNGSMEAFSTGDPWPSRISADGVGYVAALTAQIWKAHPEEYLAVRSDWVNRHPRATIALIKGLIEAQRWLANPANSAEAATILSSRKWFNVPESLLAQSLRGEYRLGSSGRPVRDASLRPLYWSSDRGVISYPYRSLTLWFLLESMRWKFYPGTLDSLAEAQTINNRTTREDLWRQAARELGVPAHQIPSGSSRGKETFFDGIVYDPANPQAYLNAHRIRR